VDAGGPAEDAGASDAGGLDAGADEDAGMDAGPDAGPVDAGPLTGESYFYVIDLLQLGAPDDEESTVVAGFDLDDRVSDRTDAESCRKEDWVGLPPESEEGVDNQLGPALISGEEEFQIQGNVDTAIQTGQLLILVNLLGVDDLEDDDRVVVEIMFGVLPEGTFVPTIVGERYAAGQTFDVDDRSLLEDMMAARVWVPGSIEGGRLTAGPGELALTIPFADLSVTLEILDMRLRMDVAESGIDNLVIGGSLDVERTLAALLALGTFDEGLTRLVLESQADLNRGEDGQCTAVSIGMEGAGVPAVRGAVRTL